MKRTLTLLLLAAAPLCAATLDTTVTGDTYIRGDNSTVANQNFNEDTANRFIVGSNGGPNNSRGMVKFDVSAIINDVNTIGGGNFANLIINSASLKVFEAQGSAVTVNVIVNQYGFAFIPSNNSWNSPASGDTTPGGTIGAVLGSQSISWNATSNDNDATIPLSSSLLRTFIAGHLANSIHFILTTNTPATNFVSISSDRAATPARDARLTVDYTVVPSVNGLANGDFEAASGSGAFPVGWTRTGAPSSVAPFLPDGGGAAAVNLATSQGILQDFAPTAAGAMENFQTDFAFQIGSESQAHRIRMEGNNGGDLVTIRLFTNSDGTDSIEVFNAASFVPALSGLTIAPETPYYLRVIGRKFGGVGRKYTVGFSTDGVTYTTSSDLFAFHNTANEKFETVTFECGATFGSSLSIDNVALSTPPDDSFSTWMLGFAFEAGADTSMEGDADQDGIANALENIFGTAPDAFSTGPAVISSSPGSVIFTHPLNPSPAGDLDYDYQWSTDLAEWKSTGEANTAGTIVDFDTDIDGNEVTVYADVTGSATTLFTRIVTTTVP